MMWGGRRRRGGIWLEQTPQINRPCRKCKKSHVIIYMIGLYIGLGLYQNINFTMIKNKINCLTLNTSPSSRLCFPGSDPGWCVPCAVSMPVQSRPGETRQRPGCTLLPLGQLLTFTRDVLRAYKRYLLNVHRKLCKHAVIMYACGI